jgi:hypothetical protein
MTSTSPQSRRLASLLLDVANNRIPASEALSQIAQGPEWPLGDAALAAYHSLVHYETDADIRANDDQYARMQADELRRWAEKLTQR